MSDETALKLAGRILYWQDRLKPEHVALGEQVALLEGFAEFLEDQLDRVDAVISDWQAMPLAAGHAMERVRDIVREEAARDADKPDGLPGPTDPEICICAAVRLPDGRVFRGHRHVPDARNAAARALGNPRGPFEHEQGLVTSRHRFVDREEGLRLQIAAGLPSADKNKDGYHVRELFSEDLY